MINNMLRTPHPPPSARSRPRNRSAERHHDGEPGEEQRRAQGDRPFARVVRAQLGRRVGAAPIVAVFASSPPRLSSHGLHADRNERPASRDDAAIPTTSPRTGPRSTMTRRFSAATMPERTRPRPCRRRRPPPREPGSCAPGPGRIRRAAGRRAERGGASRRCARRRGRRRRGSRCAPCARSTASTSRRRVSPTMSA